MFCVQKRHMTSVEIIQMICNNSGVAGNLLAPRGEILPQNEDNQKKSEPRDRETDS